MPTGTKYQVFRSDELSSNSVHFNAQGVSSSVTPGTTQNIDYIMVDDCLITGLNLVVNGAIYGDHLHFQVVDVSGVFTGVPGTVLNQVATNWYVSPTVDNDFQVQYPAKILAGMALRAVFVSTGTQNSIFVALNYKLHKILA